MADNRTLFTNVLAMLENAAANHADRPALVHLEHARDTQPRVVTYAELMASINAIAAGLVDAGVGPDHAVAILSPTNPESLIAFAAAASVGSAFPINPLLTPDALAHQLTLANAKACIVHGADPQMPIRDKLLATLGHEQPLDTVIEIATPYEAEAPYPASVQQLSWSALLEKGGSAPQIPADPRRVAAMFHTGGTSGSPKLAEIGEAALAAGPQIAAKACNWLAEDRVLSLLPHFHVGGTLCMTLAILAQGGSIYTCGRLGGRDPELVTQMWTLCNNHQITLPTMVPTSWSAIMDNAEGQPPASMRGVMTGGAAAPPELVERVEKTYGLPMSQVFGMTEFAGICTAQPVDGTYRSHAVGYVPEGMEMELDPIGEGLNIVRLKGPNMFLGYRTVNGRISEPDEWVVTGDLGALDDEGQLRLLGRSKDVIIRSGHNIDPATIEDVAYMHPGVAHAAAVGIPDAYAGELPVLFVVRGTGQNLDGLEQMLAEQIDEPPARPKRIIEIDALPLTPVGKIERYRLRQRAAIIRAGELLEDMEVEAITCTDPGARVLTIQWKPGTAADTLAAADQILGKLGLSARHEVAEGSASTADV